MTSSEAGNIRDLITEGNRAFYTLTAAEYDKMGNGMVVKVAQENASNMLERIPGLRGGTAEVMDFAAGTGLLAMFLAPHCRRVVAVDQSKEMVAQLQAKLDKQEGTERITNILPVVTNIIDTQGADSPLYGQTFDVITCTNAFHHLSDPAQVSRILASHLKPGGFLGVVDLVKTADSAEFHKAPMTQQQSDGTHHQVEDAAGHVHKQHHAHGHSHGHKDHEHVIAHKGGFSKEEMEQIFASAGLVLVGMDKSTEFEKGGKTYDNFLAIAKKAS
ncbi:S-adenosyl-L-methionine-dependent methyltransferase [Testicularia cyperi]|uniref:S-adenosyl-L-methionine-dependent methyltransferase n=1 Tax=Testicularia cyperi TaxID=1882483 RepID=A0A317XWJ0_9BASI|nr:S-adenosyl-L-methionine-dependent methyltransferase [Testicularia cyperi]